MNRARYPKSWPLMARLLKELSNWHCAECGRPCRRPGEDLADLEERIEWPDSHDYVSDDETGEWGYIFRAGRFTLTVAHIDHDPNNSDPQNLLPLCAPCHCKMDIKPAAIARKIQLRLEYEGQLKIPGIENDP